MGSQEQSVGQDLSQGRQLLEENGKVLTLWGEGALEVGGGHANLKRNCIQCRSQDPWTQSRDEGLLHSFPNNEEKNCFLGFLIALAGEF